MRYRKKKPTATRVGELRHGVAATAPTRVGLLTTVVAPEKENRRELDKYVCISRYRKLIHT